MLDIYITCNIRLGAICICNSMGCRSNCASNVGRKLVIVRGAYYCFLPTLQEQLIPNTMANHAITN